MKYPGESDAKKVVRGWFYVELLRSWTKLKPEGRICVTLLGAGGELPALRLLARLFGVEALVVDVNREAVARWRHEADSSVRIEHRSWEETIASLPDRSIAFAHFDGMGFTQTVIDACVGVRKKLAHDGVLACTASYGRETDENFIVTDGSGLRREGGAGNRQLCVQLEALLASGNRVHNRPLFVSPARSSAATRRSWLVAATMATALGHTARGAYHASYVGHKMPMYMQAFTKGARPWGSTAPTSMDLRRAVLDCAKRDIGDATDDVVCALFNVQRGTLAAWRAHETRGTYKQESHA